MTDTHAKASLYLQWCHAELQYLLAYHDQKERAAWTATTVYVPTIILLANQARQLSLPTPGKVALSIVLVVALSALAMFLTMQFNRRWVAADHRAGIERLWTQLIATPELLDGRDAEEFLPLGADASVWPKFVRDHFMKYRMARPRADIGAAVVRGVLFLWDDLFWPPFHYWPAVEVRLKSEAASYIFVLLATAIAMGTLWM